MIGLISFTVLFAILALAAATMSVVGYLIARKVGIGVIWLTFLPVGGTLLIWAGATAWIFSPFCQPVDICDSGGWLASTANLFIIFIPVLIGNMVGFFGCRLAFK